MPSEHITRHLRVLWCVAARALDAAAPAGAPEEFAAFLLPQTVPDFL